MHQEFSDLKIELNFFTKLGYRNEETRRRINVITTRHAVVENCIATVKNADFNVAISLLRDSRQNERLDTYPYLAITNMQVLKAADNGTQSIGIREVRKANELAIITVSIVAWKISRRKKVSGFNEKSTGMKWPKSSTNFRHVIPVLPQWQDEEMRRLNAASGMSVIIMMPVAWSKALDCLNIDLEAGD